MMHIGNKSSSDQLLCMDLYSPNSGIYRRCRRAGPAATRLTRPPHSSSNREAPIARQARDMGVFFRMDNDFCSMGRARRRLHCAVGQRVAVDALGSQVRIFQLAAVVATGQSRVCATGISEQQIASAPA